jgi:hypothetical protein
MIVTRVIGGLGNQMFQYASAYAVAKKNNTELRLDISWYEERNSSVWTMNYALDCFDISAQIIHPMEYTLVPRIGFRQMLNSNNLIEYKESGMPYDPAVFYAGNRLVMDGYWQSEKYFLHYRQDILKEFAFASGLKGKNRDVVRRIVNTNAASLHVRRGDYANHAQTTVTHGLMPLDYYAAAVKHIQTQVPDVIVFVFSDEPEWCEENIVVDAPMVFVSGNKGHEDMQLMSMCKHHILANSSFSWWGAWLNPSKEKIVIAPKKWFNDTSLDSKDIVPKSWIRL